MDQDYKKKYLVTGDWSQSRLEAKCVLVLLTLCNITEKKKSIYEPQGEKTYLLTHAHNEDSTKPVHLRSLVWVFVVRMKNAFNLGYPNAPREDSGQTAQMRSLIWIFARRACAKVHFLILWLICTWESKVKIWQSSSLNYQFSHTRDIFALCSTHTRFQRLIFKPCMSYFSLAPDPFFNFLFFLFLLFFFFFFFFFFWGDTTLV